jgi:hypothetical protein
MGDASKWMTYKGVDLLRWAEGGPYYYTTSRIEIDADGAPNAYGPSNTRLDNTANAGYPNGNWRSILVPDPNDANSPFVQPDGDFQGFYVSQTTLKDQTLNNTDINKYVNASAIPYIVFPGNFYAMNGTGAMGDCALVRNLSNGMTSPAIVADVGPGDAALGEISIQLAVNLGGTNPNPRNGAGAPAGPFQYVIFPGSRQTPPWPLTAGQIDTIAAACLDQLGGWAAIS